LLVDESCDKGQKHSEVGRLANKLDMLHQMLETPFAAIITTSSFCEESTFNIYKRPHTGVWGVAMNRLNDNYHYDKEKSFFCGVSERKEHKEFAIKIGIDMLSPKEVFGDYDNPNLFDKLHTPPRPLKFIVKNGKMIREFQRCEEHPNSIEELMDIFGFNDLDAFIDFADNNGIALPEIPQKSDIPPRSIQDRMNDCDYEDMKNKGIDPHQLFYEQHYNFHNPDNPKSLSVLVNDPFSRRRRRRSPCVVLENPSTDDGTSGIPVEDDIRDAVSLHLLMQCKKAQIDRKKDEERYPKSTPTPNEGARETGDEENDTKTSVSDKEKEISMFCESEACVQFLNDPRKFDETF